MHSRTSLRAFFGLYLTAAGLSNAMAQTLGQEADELGAACGDIFRSLNAVKTCPVFLFHGAKPIRLSLPKNVVPGGGPAFGAVYSLPLPITDWADSNLTLEGGSSLRQFWFGNAVATFKHRKWRGNANTADEGFQASVYLRSRGLPLMPFYGLGGNTSRANLTDYGERDISAGATVFNPLAKSLSVGGTAQYLSIKINGIRDPKIRSIDSLYSEATVAGIAQQPRFAHFNVFLQPKKHWERVKLDTRVGYDLYHDANSGRYSTGKFRAEFLQKIYPESHSEATGGGRGSTRHTTKYDSVLYLAGRYTSMWAGSGNTVPFYLQETLGGSDIDGVPTLRGFQDYRFRGPKLFELQAQYERRLLPSRPAGEPSSNLRKAASALGVMAFYDAGEVALRASDLSFGTLRQSFGFGFTIWSGDKVWFRAYVGLGSGEGRHNFFGVSDPSGQAKHF